MTNLTLLLISLFYGALISLAVNLDGKLNRDNFSAVKILSYFALIELFVMIWFSLRPESMQRIVLVDVETQLISDFNLIVAYSLSVIGYSFLIVGAFIFSYSCKKIPYTLETLFFQTRWIRHEKGAVGLFILFIGGIFFYVFLHKLGGITFLWENLGARATIAAGLGMEQMFYSYFTLIGGVILTVTYLKKEQYLRLLVIVMLVSFIELSAGSRWFFGLYIYSVFLSYHYMVRPIKKIFNIYTTIIVTAAVIISLWLVLLREGTASEGHWSVGETIELHLIKRLGIIERQVTVVGYFSEQGYWLGSSYLGLLEAYKPRDTYVAKPPIDTGIYLRALSKGEYVNPPASVSSLQPTSWPEGNLAGYMNFGFFGYILIYLMSGAILGIIYQLVRLREKAIGGVILYALLSFMGNLNLSPYGLFNLGTILFIVTVIGLIYAFFSSCKAAVFSED